MHEIHDSSGINEVWESFQNPHISVGEEKIEATVRLIYVEAA